jgi:hypothetical protein
MDVANKSRFIDIEPPSSSTETIGALGGNPAHTDPFRSTRDKCGDPS